MYNVVFENTILLGGHAGIRTTVPYLDEAQFMAMNTPLDPGKRVLAQGISEKEAMNLTSLTPEICYLSNAIEKICHTPDGRVDPEQITMSLNFADAAIKLNRQHRWKNHLRPKVGYVFAEPGPEETDKNELLRYLQLDFADKTGDLASVELCCALLAIHIAGLKVSANMD